MFKKTMFIMLALLLAVSLVFAAGTPQTRKYGIRFEDEGAAHSTPPSGSGELYLNGDELYFIDDAGVVYQVASQKSRDIPLSDWSLSYSPISASTYPKFNYSEADGYDPPGIVWDDHDSMGRLNKEFATIGDEISPAQTYIRIPEEYAGNGTIKLKVEQQMDTAAQSATPIKVDYKYFLHTDGSADDSVATQGTAVALAGTGYLEEIALSIPDTLAAGQLLNLHVWRSNVVDSTDILKMVKSMFLFD